MAEIVDFPARLSFKIIGLSDETFVSDMERICSDCIGRPVAAMKTRDNGKYRSITVDVVIDRSDVFYQIYEAVGVDARVKFMI